MLYNENIESFNNESTKSFYQNRLSKKTQKKPTIVSDEVNQAWNKIKNNILDTDKEVLGQRKVNLNETHKNKPWFTPEIKQLSEEKKKAYLEYNNHKTEERYNGYKVIRNRVNGQIKEIKREY